MGVEEVSTIALLQYVLGTEHAKAKLIALPQVRWEHRFEDKGRKAWHEHKMKSKAERAALHLDLLDLPVAYVEHVSIKKT
mmetsp:Transcript_29199/g.67705  ORF Transcript_29199/g.67705 Transcript_29199/m.67705 type:complete len:80 (-) Transcript_29199:1142-1381(-)